VDSTGGWVPGMFPIIAGISKDLRFLYILEHPHSGSLASDGVVFASYDINAGKYFHYEEKNIFTLTYKDNIAYSTGLGDAITIINGGGREMNREKNLGLLNLNTGAFEPMAPKGTAAMTPFISGDGTAVLYAASPESNDPQEEVSQWMKKGNHFIYSVNSKTKKVTQLTKSQGNYDFSPMYIGGSSIIFFRSNLKDNLSLYKLENGKEIKITDGVFLAPTEYNPVDSFYGHFETYYYFDIK
ncbi:MAG: hypothetical protein Q8930_20960, partial [Bacillota bacterium]|nr:hypothetical protein [Bacillota bacterium]